MVDGTRQEDCSFVQYSLGHYEVLEKLGEGGIGEVYVARPTRGEHAGTLVCLKVMSRAFQAAKDSRRRAAIESLRREARVVSQLRHPNIARLLDSGAYNGVWFLAFELIKGANLGEILELQPEGLGLAPELVRRIGIEVAAALQCAHEHDVLHRDIKPQNILISTDGEVRVVDFGVAKVNARRAAEFTVGVGTPRYWAPEQVREDPVTAQTDIFALGIVLYELLTTVHPFHSDDPAEQRKSVLRSTVAPRLRDAAIPADLTAIVEGCLEPNPARRFQSAEALQNALRSGAKASGFESEMGEIANAARDAVIEVRLMLQDGAIAAGEVGNNDETALADAYRSETRHATPQELAETARDGIPGALTRHIRDEVIDDLSQLAQHAFQQRETQMGPSRHTTEAGWRHPAASDVRPAEPPTTPEFAPARDRRATVMEGTPAARDDGMRDAELQTPSRLPHRTRFGFFELGGGAQESAHQTSSENVRVERDPHRTNVVLRRRAARWPFAIAAAIVGTICALVVWSPSARQPIRQPARRPNAVHAPTPTAVEQSVPLAPPSTTATVAPENIARANVAAHVVRSSDAKSSSVLRRSKPVPASSLELVKVTIGIIPFGEVQVDGKPLGNAPVVANLAPGPHRVVGQSLQRRRTQTLVVTPETNRFVLDLRDAPSSP